ncbi:MAG: DinB family protein, partial [Chloroflexota bacterium]|nr:DinB family protein [Chloroflexota bacterium]
VLEAALQEFPRDMWEFRDEHGCWSIHEHLVHIADSEANSYIRCRRFIAEPGLELMAYDENQWASALNYHSMDTEGALELFRVLRRRTWELIRDLPESAWSNTCYHPENGDMTLEDWLDVYERHVAEHVEYMRQNYAEWLKA